MSTEAQRRAKRKYKASAKGQAAEARYHASEKGKRTACVNTQRSYARNPEPAKARRRTARKAKYGLTPGAWDALFEHQGRQCAACGSTTPRRKRGGWATDHNHKTGKLRAILCVLCNLAIGAVHDDPNRLRAIADYLERHQ